MKVYHITMTYPEREVGGAQSFVESLHTSFLKRKIESKIISVSFEKGRESRVFKPFRAPIFGEYPYRIMFCLLTALSFLKEHGREDCLIHAHDTFFGGFTGALIKIMLRKPLIVTDHGVQSVLLTFLYIERHGNTVLSRLNRTFLVLLEKFTATRADQILCVSQYSYNHFLRQGIDSAKMKIVNNGIDVKKFKPKRPVFSNNDVQILYAGRLGEEKGVNLLIEAFGLLRKEYKNLKLLIVGEGPYEASIKRMADKIDTPRIAFLPAKSANDMVDIYNDSDIAAVPSVLETGVPLVLLEAMACERVVVTSPCGSLPEIVKDVGLVASFVNPSEAVVQFRKVLDDKEGATLLAKCARQKVLKNFNWTLCFNKILNIYIELHRDMPSQNDSGYKRVWEKKSREESPECVVFGPNFASKYSVEDDARYFNMLKNLLNIEAGYILDVGCGPLARAEIFFSSRGIKTLGIDVSITTLKKARETIRKFGIKDNVHLVLGDAEFLPLKKNSVEKILCIGVFSHLPTIEAAENSLKEMHYCLKPGGFCYVNWLQNLYSFLGLQEELLAYGNDRVQLLHFRGLSEVLGIFQGAKFQILETFNGPFLYNLTPFYFRLPRFIRNWIDRLSSFSDDFMKHHPLLSAFSFSFDVLVQKPQVN